MSDFALVAAPRKTGPVFDAQAGRNYGDIAHMAWVDAQLCGLRALEVEQDAHTLSQRVQNAVAWFREHGPSNPRYEHARTLRIDLENRLTDALLHARVQFGACWWHCCSCFAALQHVAERATWLWEVAGGRFNGETPHGIWQAIVGDRRAPGAWPPEQREAWVEMRMTYAEPWNLGEASEVLRERLEAHV